MTELHEADAIIAALSVRGLLDLADTVCASRSVTRHELCGRARSQAVSAARHELWWRIRNHPERRYSFLEIARLVRRDPTTITYGVTIHQRRCGAQDSTLDYRDQCAIK